MNTLINTLNISKDEWLNARNNGLGGSDAGVIAGLNPYKSRVQLYLEKTGEISSEAQENEKMYWGCQLEDVVAKEFEKRSGLKVRRRNAILKSSEYPFMLANVDRLIVGTDEGLECKTASSYVREQWKDDNIPDMYQAQIQHYMAVTGYKAWWIAVLIGGNDFRFQRVERDQEFIDMLIQLESEFWFNHVQQKMMPEIDGSAAANDIINQMFPYATEKTTITLSDDTESLIKDWKEYAELEKAYSNLKDESANKIKLLLADNEKGLTSNHVIVWSNVNSNRFDSKAFQKEHADLFNKYSKQTNYRKFSIKETN